MNFVVYKYLIVYYFGTSKKERQKEEHIVNCLLTPKKVEQLESELKKYKKSNEDCHIIKTKFIEVLA